MRTALVEGAGTGTGATIIPFPSGRRMADASTPEENRSVRITAARQGPVVDYDCWYHDTAVGEAKGRPETAIRP